MSGTKTIPHIGRGRLLTLAAILVCWVCSGCSPDRPQRQAVQGTLTLDGKPLNGVVLVFTPTGAGQVGATTVVVAGEFSMDRTLGPSAGKHFVTLDVIQPDLEEYTQLRQVGKRPLSSLQLPSRYSKLGLLDADVQADSENVFTFNLRSR